MPKFGWIGGELCLDFVNTATWLPVGPTDDLLSSFAALVAWGQQAGLVPDPPRLLARAQQSPAQAQAVLREAKDLRAVLHVVFDAIAQGEPPAPTALEGLNRTLTLALPRLRLRWGSTCCEWGWQTDDDDIDPILPPVLWSTANLLTSPDVDAVKACRNERCGWMFVDRSRRHNRRWCQMSECGSRDKARRYYRRHKSRS